jgi:hypothetical protein
MEAGRVSGQFAVVLCFGYADRPRMINIYFSLKKLGFYIIVLAPDLQTKPLCLGVHGETGIKQSTREIFLTV